MNKLITLIILITLTAKVGFSQTANVGIGTSSPEVSAKLDINTAADGSTVKKGLMIPQLSLSSTTDASPFSGFTPTAGPATGLLVYNTNASITGTGANGVGFYYNSGTKASPVWTRVLGNTNAWLTLGNAGTSAPLTTGTYGSTVFNAGENFLGTTDAQPLTIGTENIERMRILPGNAGTGGNIGIGTKTPTSTYLLTINPTTNGVRNGIDMTMTNASSNATGINITSANVKANGIYVTNSSNATTDNVFGVGAKLSTTTKVEGYLSYRLTGANQTSYGLYGVNGDIGTYATNANTWALFSRGRAVISSESSPTSPLGVDLEVGNTTTGAGNAATIQLRQSTSNTTSGNTLANLNFGDAHATTPQAQINVSRDAAGGASDYPTRMVFSTTLDGAASPTERMRIDNAGNVGINYNSPANKLVVQGALALRSTQTVTLASGANSITVGNSSYIKLTTATASASVTLSNGLQDGQLLTLNAIATGTNGISLSNGSNLNLTKSPLNLFANSASNFVWDSTNLKWIETGHVPTLPNKQIFNYTGDAQVFIVPVGVTQITAKIWGAGGGSSYHTTTPNYSSGGSGGYIECTINVTPLQNLQIIVGRGGTYDGAGYSNYSIGGGADAGGPTSTTQSVGSGGDYSGIFNFAGTITYAIAGGGGGAGGRPPNSACTSYTNGSAYGGGGGGSTGGNGGGLYCPNTGAAGGKGGTSSTGGAGGTSSYANGSAGGAFIGGLGAAGVSAGYGGGGGGGGYYGGGGGAGGNPTGTGWYPGGGGGGSSYVNTTYATSITNTQGGTSTTAGIPSVPNSGNSDYISGVGVGGYFSTPYLYGGGPGEVVISW